MQFYRGESLYQQEGEESMEGSMMKNLLTDKSTRHAGITLDKIPERNFKAKKV